jgi:DNA invertase Pin-like site-specific DNA recombinase
MECVSYLRVSTQRQGASGLGLEAQRSAVADFCKAHGMRVVREFQEIESGKRNDRPILREAIAYAKQAKKTLLIAKLDRLARNVHFISGLMESGVDFRACDLPEANRLLLHVMAAVAEAEAKAISDRTIAALRAAKERGTPLGAMNPASRNLTQEAATRGAQATAERARKSYATVLPLIQELRAQHHSLARLASTLNEKGFRTQTGAAFTAVQVKRVIDRAKEI